MGLHVGSQVWSVSEAFLTDHATVWFVTRVGPHVPLQQPGPRKGLATELTLMVQVVSENVHGKGGHADVHLVTDVALLGIVAVETPVRLPVSRKVAASRIMFSTVTACVLWFLASLLQPILRSPICDGQLGVGWGVGVDVGGGVGTGSFLVDYAGLTQGVWSRLEPGGMDAKGVSCVCSRIGDGRRQRHVVANLLILVVIEFVTKITIWNLF